MLKFVNKNNSFLLNGFKRSFSSETPSRSVKKLEYYRNLNSAQKTETKPSNWEEAAPFEQIPGPKPLPIIGNIWRFIPGIGNLSNMDFTHITKK